MFSAAVIVGQQVERLEDEADRSRRSSVSALSLSE
jgi:hypothetical protein